MIVALSIFLLLVAAVSIYKWQRADKYRIARFPHPPVFQYTIDKPDSSDNSLILLSPYKLSRWIDGQLLIIDKTGRIHYQKNFKGAPFCFRQWNINGHTRYTFLIDDSHVFHIPKISLAAGYAVVLDDKLNIIKEIRLLPYADLTTANHHGLDLHDLILLSDDHYIIGTVVQKQVNNVPARLNPAKELVVDVPIIQEVNQGRVVWQWDASRFPELYEASILDNNFSDTASKLDYLHINSFTLDPKDSNLVCSFRHTNQIIKISRKSGEILWKLGGTNSDFPLSTEQVFLGQHSVTFADDNQTLLIFDNGDSTKRKQTRILEMQLDEKNKHINNCEIFNIPEPFSLYMGSVAKKGDIYFIAGGTGNYLLEINKRTGKKLFEMHCNLALYRAYTIPVNTAIPEAIDQQCKLLKDSAEISHK